MNSEKDRQLMVDWYLANKVAADRIINDLRKQTYEAVMHMYAYTAKLLQLEYVVSQQDFPHLFSNHYTRVGDNFSGIMALLISEWNINIGKKTIDNTLSYWLTSGNLYETLVSKIIIKVEDAKDRLLKNGYTNLKELLIETSMQNNIKSQGDWNHFFGIKISNCMKQVQEQKLEEKTRSIIPKEIPKELQSKKAQEFFKKGIQAGLFDSSYDRKETKILLVYYCNYLSEE